MVKKILLVLLFFFLSTTIIYSQCANCGVTNPTGTNYTFLANTNYCFTSNTTFSDVTFGNNVKICIASGVTLTIQNNINYSTANPAVNFEIAGTLTFLQSPQINANLTVNIQNTGVLKVGSSGQNNLTLNGNGTNTLINYGTVQMSVLGFNQSGATNYIDNYGSFIIGQNINISGITTFRNNATITIGQNYNNNSTSTYINCGTINSAIGYNLGGGRVINTGMFNVGSGSIDMSGNSSMENYGTMRSLGTINGSTSANLYNEGVLKITNLQLNGGTLKGPSSASKKGYVYVINKINPNGLRVGPNLDLQKYTSYNPDVKSASQGESAIFNSAPVYVNSSGTAVTQSVANVTYDCATCPSSNTTIAVCPTLYNATFPPVAEDDYYTLPTGTSSTTSILNNDLEQYNGSAATTSNVIITQLSTTNSGVNINTSTGLVNVGTGTAIGIYYITYQICRTSDPSSCDTAIVTVNVTINTNPQTGTICYKNPILTGTILDTNQGISDLGRAADNADNWPMVRKGGWTALEALTKGFVLNRLTNAQIAALQNPVEGMIVYSITDDCIKINTDGSSTGWKCFTVQNCPD